MLKCLILEQVSTRVSVTTPHKNPNCLFLHSKYLNSMGGISSKCYSISHYSMEKGMVNHNNSICLYKGLNRSNYIASSTQFICYVVYVWFPGKCIINY